MMSGIAVNDETLAIEAIKSVGPGGNFLAQKHTLNHMHQLWLPKYMDRRPYDVWEENQDGPRDWARSEAIKILDTHKPEPLDASISNELSAIISSIEQG
jgi:trimethylamine--corrinoid protein Co-methyltransferase